LQKKKSYTRTDRKSCIELYDHTLLVAQLVEAFRHKSDSHGICNTFKINITYAYYTDNVQYSASINARTLHVSNQNSVPASQTR
jgi:hypothetical protein